MYRYGGGGKKGKMKEKTKRGMGHLLFISHPFFYSIRFIQSIIYQKENFSNIYSILNFDFLRQKLPGNIRHIETSRWFLSKKNWVKTVIQKILS